MTSNLRVIDQLNQLTDYEIGWQQQREIHAEVVAGTAPSTVLYVEHSEVFTAGKRTQPSDLPIDGSRVIEVDRGGRITWHGPGQLVGYPIVRLPNPIDVMEYVQRLELAMMNVCAEFNIETIRVPGRTGVWVPAHNSQAEKKICAIGVRVARGVTMHGFALNCNPDLDWYSRIVPCGIDDAGVTSITAETGTNVSVEDCKTLVMSKISEQLVGWCL